jgi:hypothetical protein
MTTLKHFNPFKSHKHQHIINILAIRFWGLLSQGVGNYMSKTWKWKANHSQWHKVEVKPTNIAPKWVVKEILTIIIAALATQPCPNDKWGKRTTNE